jgi:hypothetical protein
MTVLEPGPRVTDICADVVRALRPHASTRAETQLLEQYGRYGPKLLNY